MTTAWGGVSSDDRAVSDALQYMLGCALGVLAGWIDIKFSDLLFTALIVLMASMVLGFMRPKNAWRWVLLVGIFVPLTDWFAYSVLSQKPDRAQIYEAFLAFLPGIGGAYGGAFGRTVVKNLFPTSKDAT